MKWYNGLFTIRQFLDEEKEDYDLYTLGCQVEAKDKATALIMMISEIRKFGRLETEYGIEFKFQDFCTEDDFDYFGCEVI